MSKSFNYALYVIIFCSAVLLNAVTKAYAQNNSCSYQKVGQVSLQDVNGFLLATVQINGRPFNMVVDTGSEGSLISPQGARSLNLPLDPNRQTVVQGPRGGQDLVQNVWINHIKLGKLTIGPLSVPLGNLPAYPRLDIPVIGLIGGDILSHFDLEFDVPEKLLTFWDVQARSMLCKLPPFWGNAMQQVGLQMVGHRPFIQVHVDRYPLVALLDSGARSRIIAFHKVLQMGISYQTLTKDPGGIASGVDMRSTRYYWHHFKTFQLGNEIEHNPILTVSPLQDSMDMLIGSDWFATRKVWISYARHMLFFTTNTSTKK
ncbi:aspartyl protease family protein [Commensalibacter oyaizuii]|uniref:Retroviral-like aspartic protease family protein n=1 Tax=Commensalibacter oyaizuii TaxID=3043873 RepID=A0ABT6PZ97_9PROT|nr:aspartyl protease family protein [Commensalibacter sp. TBRC 16381]MDI2090184.1 retroviral-like aspartic protease family protein [Commensalibacter sp. TBRC 16381]